MPSVSPVVLTREGFYSVVEADLPDGCTAVGVLLQDPESDELYQRFRRDWDEVAPEDDVFPLLPGDLTEKAREMGAGKLLSWREEKSSNSIRVTNRKAAIV